MGRKGTGMGIQWDLSTMDGKEREWGYRELGHNGTGVQWDGGTMGGPRQDRSSSITARLPHTGAFLVFGMRG